MIKGLEIRTHTWNLPVAPGRHPRGPWTRRQEGGRRGLGEVVNTEPEAGKMSLENGARRSLPAKPRGSF